MPPRCSLDVAGKAARKASRKTMGPLRRLVVTKRTETRYTTACTKFFQWLSLADRSIPDAMADFDDILAEYIEHLWEDGAGRAESSYVAAGLQHFVESVKGNIPCTWRLAHAWRKHELPARAPPFSLQLIEALAGWAVSARRPDFAAALLLGFHCMLRTGEICKVSAGAISFNKGATKGALNLGYTKMGSREGMQEHVTITEKRTACLVAAAVRHLQPGDGLFRGAEHDFRRLISKGCDALLVSEWAYRGYSIRRGGATHYFRVENSMEGLLVRGRWSSTRAARLYLNDGLATLASLRWSPEAHAAINLARSEFLRILRTA
jgi:hypothetical protein